MTETLALAAPETVTPLKPSEALRLGRLTRPRRTTGGFFDGTTGACALGSMLAATGYAAGDPAMWDLEPSFPGLFGETYIECPVDACDEGDIADITAIVNDDHHWSDDQIVAWLEGLGL